jgi:hypothetical protein
MFSLSGVCVSSHIIAQVKHSLALFAFPNQLLAKLQLAQVVECNV